MSNLNRHTAADDARAIAEEVARMPPKLREAFIAIVRALAGAERVKAGLAAQVRFAFRIFGERKPERLGIDPDDYHELGGLEGGGGAELLRSMLAGAELLRSMLAGAEHMAGQNPDN